MDGFDTGAFLFQCRSCGYSFPVVEGRFPLLMKDYRRVLIASHLAHEAFVHENERVIGQVTEAIEKCPARADLLSRVIDAYCKNNQYFERTLNAIRTLLPEHQLELRRAESDLPEQYPIDNGLSCFIRDWSGQDCTEQEIGRTMTTLLGLVDEFACDVHSVFVPGAGTGRFACEVAARYDECYALDNAFHMVRDFYNVLNEEVIIHDINLHRNVIKSEDVVQKWRLTFRPPDDGLFNPVSAPANLSFFVGDALNAPFPDSFFSAIMCIYFIDIIPLRRQLDQAERLLKPGGIFLNFGPLRYGRGDINNMLSGEEILSAFKDAGFEILAKDVVRNTQFADPFGLTQIESRNFVFVARKVG